jgi:hypothetical protein
MSRLREFWRRLRSMSPNEIEEGGRPGAANVDALSTAHAHGKGDAMGGANLGSDVPPGYVKTYDEGRPSH